MRLYRDCYHFRVRVTVRSRFVSAGVPAVFRPFLPLPLLECMVQFIYLSY